MVQYSTFSELYELTSLPIIFSMFIINSNKVVIVYSFLGTSELSTV